MNRFKKELRKRGVKLESDYICMPYLLKGGVYLEGIHVNSEYCLITRFYDVDTIQVKINRDFTYSFTFDD